MRTKTIIMGAAGRDFHNFNVAFRDDDRYEVVAFTATQIPDIAGRRYPAALAGRLYPEGIPIYAEDDLTSLIESHGAGLVVFSYSDVSHEYVMHRGAQVNAAGADFMTMGAARTMLTSARPVVAVCAVRTGAGKSQTTRKVAQWLRDRGLRVAAVRHPMPYGDLAEQKVQRFGSLDDLVRHKCTIEEVEEYEPHIVSGTIIYAGVDYEAILRQAETEADVVLWDGGNNDLPFYRPDLHIVVADPLRAGHELTYYPGETNVRMADAVVINKVDSADASAVDLVRANIRRVNPDAVIVEAASPASCERPDLVRGKRVLVVEDGPTVTHGEMKFGAGTVVARKFGAREIVDPRPFAVGRLAETYAKYPGIGTVLPAMGYGEEQTRDLAATIAATPCDTVIVGTPIDLARIITISQPSVRVRYDLQEIGRPDLTDVLAPMLERIGASRS
ncbi:MAG: cyclic 2,3-diphosphoglycerate synthase [Vicinamibacteraceae bacterium]|nr:cyclic 2,3-diphosphoglycerate synthase [Vicinamibacteraceae bacterium]